MILVTPEAKARLLTLYADATRIYVNLTLILKEERSEYPWVNALHDLVLHDGTQFYLPSAVVACPLCDDVALCMLKQVLWALRRDALSALQLAEDAPFPTYPEPATASTLEVRQAVEFYETAIKEALS